ncbi:Tetracycline resistance protein, class C [Anatilimnocola aggregata]|uniref:Tetracycline resistance protein, class C n=1 Tax=Anatilimnocola aggregata TaxID=2528021 RepID=A0A517YB41_9BACT|nr:MFS transporter [Anatilimnocola aggregata]QDU27409.1 Tetracycline resistance protein, class C [Anatilimnocola aggregata]
MPAQVASPLAGERSNSPDTNASKGSLLVVFLTVFIDLLGFGMVLPLLPLYAEKFGIAEHGWELGLLMAIFSMMQFIFSPLWGRVSDRIGRRPVIIIGLIGSVVCYTLFGIAAIQQSLLLLFISRTGAGIAGATISTAAAYIADVTTKEKRAKGMALIGVSFGLGFTFGPLLAWAALLSARVEPTSEGPVIAASATDNLDVQLDPAKSSAEIAKADKRQYDEVARSPLPGFVAAGLSLVALLLAVFLLPESLRPGVSHTHMGLFDLRALRDSVSTPTIAALLFTSFLSVTAFGGFETTAALLLKDENQGFGMKFGQIPLFFAYIGIMLSLVQGGVVRRLSTRLSEVTMAEIGFVLTTIGFVLLTLATLWHSWPLLFIATAVSVGGFAFTTPSLSALISRRSDPDRQGGIMGVSQGVSALARIAGPLFAIPLFKSVSAVAPYYAAIGLMIIALLSLIRFARHGRDFGSTTTTSADH